MGIKIGHILGALSPGLSATGLFGNNAQSVGGGMLGAMSPLLGLLMAMNKKKKGKEGETINVTQNPTAQMPQVGSAAPPQMNPMFANPMFPGMGG